MSRFITLLAVAAVAGVMYVAAAPGSVHSAGPTNAQFKALKLHVANLQKSVVQVRRLAVAEALVLADCVLYHAQAVDDFGDGSTGTYGYSYSDPQQNGGQPFLTTALDLAPSGETNSQFHFLGVNPDCASSINSNSNRTSNARSGALRRLFALADARGGH